MTASVEGRTLGPYRIGTKLGAGGIGAVYEATHVRTGRVYAVKVLLPESTLEPNALRRFRREAEALARLGHASIVAVHDFDVTADGVAFLVMDRLHGEDLATRLERGPLPLDTTLRIFDEIAEALAAAHEAKILHRDLKPSNVFLARRPGAPERAILLDFGLAKMMNAGESQRLTATGAAMGTPIYMSPEQAQGLDLDERTDVYSLAAILFEMLTGAPPFTGPTLTAILAKVLTHPPPPLRSIEPSAPEVLDPVVRGALAKSPDQRPPTVRAFKAQVLRVTTAVAATTPSMEPAALPHTRVTPPQVPVSPSTPATAPTVGAPEPTSANATPRTVPGHAVQERGPKSASGGLWAGLGLGLAFGLAAIAWLATGEPTPDVPAPVVPAEVASPRRTFEGPAPSSDEPRNDEPPPTSAPQPEPTAPGASSARATRTKRRLATRRTSPPPTEPQRASPAEQRPTPEQPPTPAPTERTVNAQAQAALRRIDEARAQARANAEEHIRQAQAKIAALSGVLPLVARLRRQVGSPRARPPICERRDVLERIGRLRELEHSVRSLDRQIERACGIFDGLSTSRAEVRSRIAELREGFARARRGLQRRPTDRLSAAQRDALIAEIDALERRITTAERFPCGAPQLRNLLRHADTIGPQGAHPALEAGRAVVRVCSDLRYSQLAPTLDQIRNGLDELESLVHQHVAAQQRIIEAFERGRSRDGVP